jgi:tetratricopeptide (TPR) repeat protein
MNELSDEELWGELTEADGQRRGEILLELADRCYHRNDMIQFETLVEAAAEASESAGDDRLAAYARFNQGQGLMELERFDEAVSGFLSAAQYFGSLGAQGDVALATQRAADGYAALADLESAVDHWQTALALFESEADHLSAGRVHMAMGAAYINTESSSITGTRGLAEQCFTRARAAFRQARSAQHVAWADDAAAEALIQQGRTPEALPLLRSCLDIARVGSDDVARGYAGLRLGLALRILGHHTEALEHLRDSRSAYQSDENLIGVARCDLEAAHALRALRDEAAAENLYQGARSIFDAMGADDYLVLTDRARAELFLATGRAGEAAAVARESLANAVEVGESVLALDHAALLAEALLELGADDEALTVAHTHLAAHEVGVDSLDAVRHQGVLAMTLLANGLNEQALATVDAALTMPAAHNDPNLHARLYELRWRARTPSADADRDLAHAVALYLAAGDSERATALSSHFLPEDSARRVRTEDLLSMRGLRPEVDTSMRTPGPSGISDSDF